MRRLPVTPRTMLAIVSLCATPLAAQTRLLRSPSVSERHIAFAYANNVWVVERYDYANENAFRFGTGDYSLGFRRVEQPQAKELSADVRYMTNTNGNAQDYVKRFGFDPKLHPPYLTMVLGAGEMERGLALLKKALEKKMLEHARNLEFEDAAAARDRLSELKKKVFGIEA